MKVTKNPIASGGEKRRKKSQTRAIQSILDGAQINEEKVTKMVSFSHQILNPEFWVH